MNYRNYVIEHDATTGHYVARSTDDDNFRITSFDKSRLTKAIDQLWNALHIVDDDALRLLEIDLLPIPGWVRGWLKSESNHVDIDRAFASGNC